MVAAAVPASAKAPGSAAPKALSARAHDKTSASEKKRVDAVPTPKLAWWDCYGGYQCTTTKVPLDYDDPTGPQTELALLKYPAQKPTKKIGTLFVNPGGPGGSGTELAYNAPYLFTDKVLNRFDVVGFDPRGTNFSDNVTCFTDLGKQNTVLETLYGAFFPQGVNAEAAYISASKAEGQACSTTGQPLASSMSSAEVARDLDVLRRGVGDEKLTYLGFSYGTYIGQVYANLFPDRTRALVMDGVVNPTAFRGSAATRNGPQFDRLRSADGSWKALQEILVRCDKAGGAKCSFAPGNPKANLALIAKRLKQNPITLEDFFGDEVTYSYPDLVGELLGNLYYPDGSAYIADMLSALIILTEPPAKGADAHAAKAATSAKAKAERRLAVIRHTLDQRTTRKILPAEGFVGQKIAAKGFPYDSSLDAFAGVSCTDSIHNAVDIANYPAYAAAADERAPYFGRPWLWNDAMCASNSWTVEDEDAYAGGFTEKTITPLLFVGNYWDPATRYQGAVRAAKLAPNSRLLSSDSWGHTAYGTSDCVTGAVDKYLVSLTVPKKGKVCVGDEQPFTGDDDEEDFNSAVVKRIVQMHP